MKTVGFVCEGPRDSDMLEAVLRHILNEDIFPLYLQPEMTLESDYGCGWKGVWTWCEKNGSMLDKYIDGATPQLDMLIIHMDGDVARKEREVHCRCFANTCEQSGKVFPLQCREVCPIEIPCNSHEDGISGLVSHLQELILECFQGKFVPICFIPCDSTDAWIVAAFDDIEDVEMIEDPWNTIISRKKDYHGIKVPGHNKSQRVYQKLIPVVCENWEKVKKKCSQAEMFEHYVLNNVYN